MKRWPPRLSQLSHRTSLCWGVTGVRTCGPRREGGVSKSLCPDSCLPNHLWVFALVIQVVNMLQTGRVTRSLSWQR